MNAQDTYGNTPIADCDDKQFVQTRSNQRHLIVALQLIKVRHSAGVLNQLVQLFVDHLAQMRNGSLHSTNIHKNQLV